MLVRLSSVTLKDGRWYEYVVRFLLGGAATLVAGLLGMLWGPGVGGLFLAFPAMLCASATLVESHERRHKSEAGLEGRRRGKDAAALDAAGAALGSIALVAFAATVLLVGSLAPWGSLVLASLAWAVTAACSWWAYKRIRRMN
ncbi:hypothetical protein [Tardiphaga sp.]|uniref:hypothetical protein n=1 Tax=Tardiphaga sp. TaxID=1926292 RepID=UPI002632B50A|nr:hypothetical protein [Tardiphaga sp.]MDB5621157.1 hypothetical protein [Tardiphaga sp.]